MNHYKYYESFSVLGCDFLVLCKHESCMKAITDYLSSSVSTCIASPDVIIECDWDKPNKYLFRSRPGGENNILEGVVFQIIGNSKKPWNSHLPPIPPLAVPPIKGRYVGLHAGAVVNPHGNTIVFAGTRGSGKTSLAMHLCENKETKFITDETVFILAGTSIVYPFPIELGIKSTPLQKKKELVPSKEIFSNIAVDPVVINKIIILNKCSESNAGIKQLDISSSLRLLAPHHLDVGASHSDAIATLTKLISSSPVELYNFRERKDLYSLDI